MQRRIGAKVGLSIGLCSLWLNTTSAHAQTPLETIPPPASMQAPTPPSPPVANAQSGHVMLKKQGKTPVALQTAISSYTNPHGTLTIDLVSAVHLGEEAYYQELNKRLSHYDVVLYELVAPPGAVPKPGEQREGSPLSAITGMMQSMLGLQSQLQKINYRRPNFVHADLSPAQLSAKMKQRGENWLTMGLGTLIELMQKQQSAGSGQDGMGGLVEALSDPLRLKRMLAEGMVDSGKSGLGLGSSLNRLLIKDRNQAALNVLRTEVAKGRHNIAIFYGAAHMPDLEQHITQEFGVKLKSRHFLTAWDLTHVNGSSANLLPNVMKLMQGMGQ